MAQKSYRISIQITEKDLMVLKKALKHYKAAPCITACLLGIIEYQEGVQNGK